MHKISMFSSIALIAGLALTGCSSSTPLPASPIPSEAQATASISTVSPFMTEFYSSLLIENSSKASENSKLVDTRLKPVLDGKKFSDVINSHSDPLKGYEKFSDEKQKEIADIIEDLNPSAKFYDFSNISDDKRAFLNMYSLGISTFASSYGSGDLVLKLSVMEEDVSMTENKALIENKDVDLTVNEETVQLDALIGIPKTHLVFVSGEWKIDAASSVADLEKLMDESSAAPVK